MRTTLAALVYVLSVLILVLVFLWLLGKVFK